MFASAELGRKVSKEDYAKEEAELRNNLLEAQYELKNSPFPVIVLVSGVEAGGKGETVNTLLEWLDPRHIEVNSFGDPSDEETERPLFWKFWRALPPRGKVGIFYGSWYTEPIVKTVWGEMKRGDLDKRVQQINTFEKLQADDGALFVKYWLHLSKKSQRARMQELENDKRTSWRVTKQDWRDHERYDDYVEVCEQVLRATSTGQAPWHVIEAEDWRYRNLSVGRLLLDGIRAGVAKRAKKGTAAPAAIVEPTAPKGEKTVLSSLDLSQEIPKKKYESKLLKLQGRLHKLAHKAWQEDISTVVVYEGQDAAGKGGNIRRMTAAIDARNYRVIPIAAPTDEERQHSYLWRFWRHIPRAGRLVLFDRSWYGRVLVERVEGFCSEDAWRRAYSEINDFEEQLDQHGIVVVKFWLQIDKDEQLRRFKEREKIAYKRYKITDEDWRNRKKWDAYDLAINEMVERTSTSYAPWTLVEANSKLWARIKCLETVCDRLEAAL